MEVKKTQPTPAGKIIIAVIVALVVGSLATCSCPTGEKEMIEQTERDCFRDYELLQCDGKGN
jgi:hypothetical protein